MNITYLFREGNGFDGSKASRKIELQGTDNAKLRTNLLHVFVAK